MERTYVFNTVFKIMAVAGILSIFGLAGTSDLGSIGNAELFLYVGLSILASYIGIWGTINCTRAIEAMKRRERREIERRVAAIYSAKAA